LFKGEGEEGDAVNGNFGVIGGRLEICEWVWVKFEEGGEVFGERGKVWLEGSGRGGGVGGEGDSLVLVDCSCESQGEVAADALEIRCGNNRELGGPLFMF
jgi:hypothetical protein